MLTHSLHDALPIFYAVPCRREATRARAGPGRSTRRAAERSLRTSREHAEPGNTRDSYGWGHGLTPAHASHHWARMKRRIKSPLRTHRLAGLASDTTLEHCPIRLPMR